MKQQRRQGRQSRSAGLAAVLAVVVFAGVPASSAVAKSIWTPPQGLSVAESDGELPQVAIADDGSAVAVWRILDKRPGFNKYRLQAAFRKRGEAFSRPTFISGEDRLSGAAPPVRTHFRLKMNRRGDAIVVWETTESNGKPGVRSAFKPAGGTFGNIAEIVDREFNNARLGYVEPEVGIDGQGNATVIYHQRPATGFNSNPGIMQGSSYTSKSRPAGTASTWGDPRTLAPHPPGNEAAPLTYNETHGSIAVTEAGDRFAAFASQTFESGVAQRQVVSIRRRDADEASWQYQAEYDDTRGGDTEATDTRVAYTRRGAAAVVWREGDFSLYAEAARIGGLYAVGPFELSLALDSPGNPLALWGDGSGLYSAYRPSNAAPFGPADSTPVPTGPGSPAPSQSRPKLAADGSGSVLSVFQERDNSPGDTNGDETVLSALRAPGGTSKFGAPEGLSVPGDLESDGVVNGIPKVGTGPTVAMSSGGEGVAAWSRLDGRNLLVEISLLVPEGIAKPPPAPPRPQPPVPSEIQPARPFKKGEATVLTANVKGRSTSCAGPSGTVRAIRPSLGGS